MKSILVPLDGSALAEQVLPFVRTLAPLLDARVQLLHVVFETGDVTAELAEFAEAPLRRNAESYLHAQATKLGADDLETDAEVQLGVPAEVIVEAAARKHVALIAMASHGYSGLKRWALGSVTTKVIHATYTPVLVVRGAARVAALKRILVPLDGSALARQALPFAAELATRAGAELLVLTVAAPPLMLAPELASPFPSFDEALAALKDQLKDELGSFADQLSRAQVPITPLAVSGFPADAIVDQAAHRQADLIVMATHGRSGLKRWTLGSVAEKVLHATATPLVLVRAQE
jgi:nucleotide-binding universal stress UspA family protein